MIVDCHTHINCPVSDTDAAEHLEACQKIDASIVHAPGCQDTEKDNKHISDYVKQNSKMIGFAVINPVTDKIARKKIAAVTAKLNLKGITLYCCEGNFHPAHSRAMRLYQVAEELKLPIFFHNSQPFGPQATLSFAQPYLLDEVAAAFPSLKIVIGSMGMPFLSQTICMLKKHENVYADLSIFPKKIWEVYNVVVQAYEARVMGKLFFGSAFPLARPDNCIETLLGFNKIMADTNLPAVPREQLRSVVERDTLGVLGIEAPSEQ